jgi:hypothetical protein
MTTMMARRERAPWQRRDAAENDGALATDDDEAEPAGSATQSAVPQSGAPMTASSGWRTTSRSRAHGFIELERRLADSQDEQAGKHHADDQRRKRNDEGFRRLATHSSAAGYPAPNTAGTRPCCRICHGPSR